MDTRGNTKIVRWRRYGQDRLYVSDLTGQPIGWHDLKSGASSVEVPAQRAAFDAAIASYINTESPPAHAEPGQPRDLALNLPGEAARARAEAELAAMKDRTRVGTFIARMIDLKTDERSWRVGASGEETVGERLEKLKVDGWFVLHAVPVGTRGSDIDHVVIGHGGVYTINTKTHPGGKIWVSPKQIRVNGHPEPYLRNSRFEGDRASKLLSAAVGFPVIAKPVLIFLTGTWIPNVTIRQRPDDVLILDRLDVPKAFQRAPQRLSQEEASRLFDVARRSTTWV